MVDSYVISKREVKMIILAVALSTVISNIGQQLYLTGIASYSGLDYVIGLIVYMIILCLITVPFIFLLFWFMGFKTVR